MKTIILGILYTSILTGLMVHVKADHQINVEIKPLEAVRRVGDELTVLCKVHYPIDSCRMKVGTTVYKLIPDNVHGDVVYAGRGLEAGECGALIKNIKEEWNGKISCVIPPLYSTSEVVGTMRLLVAKAPGDPVLSFPEHLTFNEGDNFTAQCVAPNGRPAAKISWLLGTEELLVGKQQPVVTTDLGLDLQNISQNVSKMLTDEDDTKFLVCRVEHEALMQPKEARRQLIVQYPPKRRETGTITIYGQKLGHEGRLNVTVRANPKPKAEWIVGNQVLTTPVLNESGKFVAVEPLLLGNGYYNVTLIVAPITQDDVDRTYYLLVHNGLGREVIPVRINTIDEFIVADASSLLTIIISSIAAIVLILILPVVIYVIHKRCQRNRRERSQRPSGPTPRQKSPNEPNPHSPFYVNMLFREQCEREIRAQEEPQYEEIMYQ